MITVKRLRESPEIRREQSGMSLDLENLVARVRDAAGEKLDRIVLYGSFAWGEGDPEGSDIDVAIMLRSDVFKDAAILRTALDDLKFDAAFGPLSERIEFSVRGAAVFFALRDFLPCMESKVLRLGRDIWVSPVPATYPVLSELEACRLVVERGLEVAAEKIDYARIGLARSKWRGDWQTFEGLAAERAQMCACFSLRALAYARRIDPSEKSVRWRVSGLLDLLDIEAPAWSAALPDHYFEPAFDRSEAECRRACVAAILIYRKACRETQSKSKTLPASQLLEVTRKGERR